MNNIKYIITAVICLCCALVGGYIGYEYGKGAGYTDGYRDGYNKGYSDGYADKGKLSDNSTVKTETVIQYQKVPYTGTDVSVTTKPPTVSVSVNGKKQEIQQKTETADLQVQTNAEVKIKIPERKWKIGLGTDGHKPMYMLSTPAPFIKNDAIGLWVAGGSHKVMGGVTISF